MRTRTETRSTGFAAIALSAIVAACASGGGGPPMTEAEAWALLADYAGRWVLDESGSSPQTVNPATTEEPVPRVISSGNRTVVFEQGPENIRAAAIRRAMHEVLRARPKVLSLRVDGIRLVYAPLPGRSIEVPMNGESASRTVEGRTVRTRFVAEEGGLALEHVVDMDRRVREVLRIVGGRLRITRTIVRARDVDPFVLVYDRWDAEPD